MKVVGNVSEDGILYGKANGVVTDGVPVVWDNETSTVRPVTLTGSAQDISSAVEFEAGAAIYQSAVYDEETGSVVICYQDGGNNNYGTAVVGTPTASGLVFGTPIVFSTATSSIAYISATMAKEVDGVTSRLFIAYAKNSGGNSGSMIVGTIHNSGAPSAATITFGPEDNFEGNQIVWVSTTFDSIYNKVLVNFRRTAGGDKSAVAKISILGNKPFLNGTNEVNTLTDLASNSIIFDPIAASTFIFTRQTSGGVAGRGVAQIITFSPTSNTTIEVGSTINVFESASGVTHFASVVVPKWNRVVLIYNDSTKKGVSRNVTASGVTADSLATGQVSLSATSTYDSNTTNDNVYNQVSYDPYNDKVLAVFKHGPTGYLSYSIGYLTNGDSITWSAVTAFPGNINVNDIGLTYVPYGQAEKDGVFVVTYADGGDNNKGKAITFKIQGTTLTPNSNFVGFSQGTSADGTNVKIKTGGSVARNLSGLKVGRQYFVYTDGTLQLIPQNRVPITVAGTAISATELIVKG